MAIAFPVIEQPLVAYLAPLVAPVKVLTRVPTDRPDEFVRLSRVGGTVRDVITDRPWVVFECWSKSDYDAAILARTVRAYVFDLVQTQIGDAWVRAVDEVGGLQAFPDPESGQARYQFSVQFDVRGTVI